MARTSFRDAEETGKTLAELISEGEKTGELLSGESNSADESQESLQSSAGKGGGGSEPEGDGQAAASEATRAAAEAAQAKQANESKGQDATNAGAAQGSPTASALARILKNSGFNIPDGYDEEELAKSVLGKLGEVERTRSEASEIKKERDRLAKEAEDLKKALEAAANQEPPTKKQQEIIEDLWSDLAMPDREKFKFVEQDPDTGLFRAKEKYIGLGGEEAAKEINKYNEQITRRSQELLRNPADVVMKTGLGAKLEQMIRDSAEKLVDEKIKSLGDIKSQAINALEKRNAAEVKEQRIAKFWEENAGRILKLDANGNPVRDIMTESVVPTEVGQAFYNEIASLRELGVKDEEAIVNKAWASVQWMLKSSESTESNAAAAESAPTKTKTEPQASKTVAEQSAEKKKRFVERRAGTSPDVHESRDGYVGNAEPERKRFTARKSLLDLVKEDPEARELVGL